MLVALLWLCVCQGPTAATPAALSRAETVTAAAVTPTLVTPGQARVMVTPAPSPKLTAIEPTGRPEPGETMILTILYDNNPLRPRPEDVVGLCLSCGER